ncbi:hypothetical protein PR001_g15285 [Phytophthora rubi]|uniref:No apical meristem-associated C-terminal domain-containing protein n=1 Tax=Phytophthora rubi TaxID=129364 RepID=A0A6A3L2N5_9STRA|nr:hypothetical protein PR001_g15285 [Phytophthora rubi]
MASSSPATSSPWASESSVAFTQLWINAVGSIESLTPELLASSCPGSEEYSKEGDELFWSWVHQGYSAQALHPSDALDAPTLRQQWEDMRPSVAEFHAILTKLWPNEHVASLDALLPRERQKLLTRAVVAFQERTGRSFNFVNVWNLLTHHKDWERVLKQLVLREGGEKSSATGGDSRVVEAAVLQKHPREDEEISRDYETKRTPSSRETGVEDGTSADKSPRAAFKATHSSKKQRVAGQTTKMVNADLGCEDQDHAAGGWTGAGREVPIVTPIHSSKTQPAIGEKAVERTRVMQTRSFDARRSVQINEDDSDNETSTADQHPSEAELSDGLATESYPNKVEETPQRVKDVHLALAWADVSCSCADMSPRLEESNDWFWFLVSSIYFDLVSEPTCRSDIEPVLKSNWLEIRNCIASFHELYEAELEKNADVSRAGRETVILRAQEAFWDQSGNWFKHRAAWEILERHTDWETVLKPLVLGSSAFKMSLGGSPPKRTGKVNWSSVIDPPDETTRGISAEPITVPAVDESPPPSFESIASTETKSSTLSAQWLEWSTHRSDLQVMTQSEVGLSSEAVEYLRLRRKKILQKTREGK